MDYLLLISAAISLQLPPLQKASTHYWYYRWFHYIVWCHIFHFASSLGRYEVTLHKLGISLPLGHHAQAHAEVGLRYLANYYHDSFHAELISAMVTYTSAIAYARCIIEQVPMPRPAYVKASRQILPISEESPWLSERLHIRYKL